jgi:hypothetical protein
VIVSQHGADAHAWDPLAHLNLTTTAMGDAARLVDAVAHRFAGGRWLATGGGGYDVYRVVPRSWSLVWMAGAHREVPDRTPEAWRERWAAEGARFGQTPPPAAFTDPPNAGLPVDAGQEIAESRSAATAALVRRVVVPRLVREAVDRGWWSPLGARGSPGAGASPGGDDGDAHILATVDAAIWARLTLASRVLAPVGASDAHAIVTAGLADGLRVTAALVDSTVVGAVVSHVEPAGERARLLGLGVAPGHRQRELAGTLLRAHVESLGPRFEITSEITVAERDPFDPIDGALRRSIGRRLLEASGFEIVPAEPAVRSADPATVSAVRAGRASAAL